MSGYEGRVELPNDWVPIPDIAHGWAFPQVQGVALAGATVMTHPLSVIRQMGGLPRIRPFCKELSSEKSSAVVFAVSAHRLVENELVDDTQLHIVGRRLSSLI